MSLCDTTPEKGKQSIQNNTHNKTDLKKSKKQTTRTSESSLLMVRTGLTVKFMLYKYVGNNSFKSNLNN